MDFPKWVPSGLPERPLPGLTPTPSEAFVDPWAVRMGKAHINVAQRLRRRPRHGSRCSPPPLYACPYRIKGHQMRAAGRGLWDRHILYQPCPNHRVIDTRANQPSLQEGAGGRTGPPANGTCQRGAVPLWTTRGQTWDAPDLGRWVHTFWEHIWAFPRGRPPLIILPAVFGPPAGCVCTPSSLRMTPDEPRGVHLRARRALRHCTRFADQPHTAFVGPSSAFAVAAKSRAHGNHVGG